MTYDRDERRVQAIADALRNAIERGTRFDVLAPFAEAIIGEEPAGEGEPDSARDLVGAGVPDEPYFGYGLGYDGEGTGPEPMSPWTHGAYRWEPSVPGDNDRSRRPG